MRGLEKLIKSGKLGLLAGPMGVWSPSALGNTMSIPAAMGGVSSWGKSFSAEASVSPATPSKSHSSIIFNLVGKTLEELEAEFKMRKGGGNIVENIEILLKRGVTKKELPRVVKAKSMQYLTGLRTETLDKKLEGLAKLLELEPAELGLIVRVFPTVMGLSWENNVEVFLNELLKSHSKLKIKRMILKFPATLGFAKKFDTLAGIMESSVGCSREEFLEMVVRFPSVLGYSVEKSTKPKIEKFLALGLSKEDVKSVLYDSPSFFGRDFEKVVVEKLTWLKEELWMKDRDGLEVLRKCPEVFVANKELWYKCLDFFVRLGWSREALTEFFKEDPVVLSHRVNLLDEKLKFARKFLKKSDEELLACPSYFSASFGKVILFRTAFWQDFGENPQKLPLSSLVGGPHSKFNEKFNAEEIKKFGKTFNKLSQAEKLKSVISRL
ncbi:hypothetical protein BSKO_12382 [Bryopsis sp. KO-2023]|nr:hypothetical protein BSKO_12382 [Bryopsis sp. KO-2023]